MAPTFGGINLEDISAPRCFEIEERLKAELNWFYDIEKLILDKKQIVIVGIGGSSLGTYAIYQFLKMKYNFSKELIFPLDR